MLGVGCGLYFCLLLGEGSCQKWGCLQVAARATCSECMHVDEAWVLRATYRVFMLGVIQELRVGVLILQGSLGARFPECLEEIMLGRVKEGVDEVKRDTAIIRKVLKKLLVALKGLHSLGEPPWACLNISLFRQEILNVYL